VTEPYPRRSGLAADRSGPSMVGARSTANLADILERVLDKGIVIAGDIKINLLDIELLTIKLRLLVASVDRAREMGIDWWEHDPSLSSSARRPVTDGDGGRDLAEENRQLRAQLAELTGGQPAASADHPTEAVEPDAREPEPVGSKARGSKARGATTGGAGAGGSSKGRGSGASR
jgi:hypothetical protein